MPFILANSCSCHFAGSLLVPIDDMVAAYWGASLAGQRTAELLAKPFDTADSHPLVRCFVWSGGCS